MLLLSRCSEEQGDGAVELDVQPPYPFNQSLPSSGDSEEEEQEGAKEDEEEGNSDIPATPWHPKPLGVSASTCPHPVAVLRKLFDIRTSKYKHA